MSSLPAIMDELAATLETALGTAVKQVVPRLNFNPTPPSIDIYPGDPSREEEQASFADADGAYIFTVRARALTADNEAGQDVLLDLMDDESDHSVAVALMDDQSLNGLASSVKVEGPSGFVQFVDSGGEGALLGCTWRVTVLNLIT